MNAANTTSVSCRTVRSEWSATEHHQIHEQIFHTAETTNSWASRDTVIDKKAEVKFPGIPSASCQHAQSSSGVSGWQGWDFVQRMISLRGAAETNKVAQICFTEHCAIDDNGQLHCYDPQETKSKMFSFMPFVFSELQFPYTLLTSLHSGSPGNPG